MNWILLGARGQLGKTLTNLLTESSIDHRSFGHSEIDISNYESIAKIESFDPGIIINCAGWTDVEGAESNEARANEVNGTGPANLAKLAKDVGIPLIHISTEYVFSGVGSKPWQSNDPTEPRSAYGRSKLLGEQRVTSIYPQGSIVLRTAWLYSEFRENFAKTILRKAIRSKGEIRVVSDQVGQPTTTYDLANRIVEIGIRTIPPGTYHAVNSGSASWWDLAVALVMRAGLDPSRIVKIRSSEYESNVERPMYSVLDLSNWQVSGFEPMRDWQLALESAFPKVINSVRAELANG